jgi:hypothetical protein
LDVRHLRGLPAAPDNLRLEPGARAFKAIELRFSDQKYRVGVIAIAILIIIESVTAAARAAGSAHPNDIARYLAGLRPAASSSLSAVTDSGWRQHARQIDAGWVAFERRQLRHVRSWSAAKLRAPRATMFYMFGGPDFVHANAFFPHATTYVLSGLEPVGQSPQILALHGSALDDSLASLRKSVSHFLEYGYFITSQMGKQFKAGKFTGTLPVLYVFLARSGKTIRQVEYVTLDGNGMAVPVRGKRKPTGVKITFVGRDSRPRALYYFSTNLENAGVAKSRFLKFCAQLGQGDSLIKSASYLLHFGGFSKVRDFLLKHSAVIVQDDSGIPLKYFSHQNWNLSVYGQYVGPIPIFKQHYQPDLAELFRSGNAGRVKFGIGYRWYYQHTNILVAERRGAHRRSRR